MKNCALFFTSFCICGKIPDMKKATKKQPKQNNIAFIRRGVPMSGKKLGEMIGELPSTVSRLESGEIDFEPYRAALAKALKCKPKDLDDSNLQKRSVPVTMWIKNKSYVYKTKPGEIERVCAIEGLPKTAEALVVKNPDHPVHTKNSLLFFDGAGTNKPARFLDRECVVKIQKATRGDTLLAWVSRGTKPNTFLLHAHGEPMVVDVTIISAHPILGIKKA